MNGLFAARGLDRAYVPLPCAPGTLAASLAALHALPFDGFNVTSPHKEEAAAATALDADARLLGAVNTLVRTRRGYLGRSTDGPGLLLFLVEGLEAPPAGRHVVVLGAGGASRSALLALSRSDPASLTVLTRDRSRFRTRFFRALARRGLAARAFSDPGAAAALARADLVVHGTPWGTARGAGRFPIPLDSLARGCLAIDMNYDLGGPTGFLAALPPGVRGLDGRGMLAGQAALGFELWTGERPRLAEVFRAGGLGPVKG